MRLPVVDRIAPELPFGAEVVGRHTRDEARALLIIQKEELRIGPHIARVQRNEERQIADQAHAIGMRVLLEPFALAEQQELRQAYLLDSS